MMQRAKEVLTQQSKKGEGKRVTGKRRGTAVVIGLGGEHIFYLTFSGEVIHSCCILATGETIRDGISFSPTQCRLHL
jgi:hypothetical protein